MGTTVGPHGKRLAPPATPIEVSCSDGQILYGHVFEPYGRAPDTSDTAVPAKGIVVIACATGVTARYYRRYAAFLAEHGFHVITFDYRGIGASAPGSLRGFRARWHDWGRYDIDAVLGWARKHHGNLPLHFVGHSFGGFGVGLAPESRHLTRILTIGAQHAHWRDYAKGHRARFIPRWHLVMPMLTLASGFFPGERSGWLEDLPRGVALDWARGRKDFTLNAPPALREKLRASQRALQAPILAISTTDDQYASAPAIARTLAYTPHAPSTTRFLEPGAYGQDGIGHFGLFHDMHTSTFWRQTLGWLEHGVDPWATKATAHGSPGRTPTSEKRKRRRV